jgi:hypothetical protein
MKRNYTNTGKAHVIIMLLTLLGANPESRISMFAVSFQIRGNLQFPETTVKPLIWLQISIATKIT